MEFFRNNRAKVVPNFIDEGRRIGGLSKGVNALVREDVEVLNRIMEHIQIG